jgi:uncharacterized protein
MKPVILLLSLLFILKISAVNATAQKQLKVLVVTDNRKFDREAFFEMFESCPDFEVSKITHPRILDFFGTDSIRMFDAVVFYDMPEQLNPTEVQKQHMIRFFSEGAPAVFLHHSLLSYRQWDHFKEIIGGRYYNKSPLITEKGDTLQSVYQHDVHYKVQVVNPHHPITRGVCDFEILDEVYNHYFVKDDVEVLLTTDHPLSGRKLGWINTYEKSRVVYLINGHGATAYSNTNFRKILQNAIRWVASCN